MAKSEKKQRVRSPAHFRVGVITQIVSAVESDDDSSRNSRKGGVRVGEIRSRAEYYYVRRYPQLVLFQW